MKKNDQFSLYEQTQMFQGNDNDNEPETVGAESNLDHRELKPQQLAEEMRDRIIGNFNHYMGSISTENRKIRYYAGITFLQSAIKEGTRITEEDEYTDVLRIIPAALHAQIMSIVRDLDDDSRNKFFRAFRKLVSDDLEEWINGAGVQPANDNQLFAEAM